MPVSIYNHATEYVANEITILRGAVGDIVSVGVYHDVNPNASPTVGSFTTVTLVSSGPLQEGSKIDVLSLIGPRAGQVDLPPGDYQRFVLITTATEDIIRKPDTLTIL